MVERTRRVRRSLGQTLVLGCVTLLAMALMLMLSFNLTNTEGLIACLIARDRELGVDVEDTQRRGETVSIADRFFSPSEVKDLHAVPEASKRDRFFDYWTLKEAYIKARGFGLALPLGDFAFRLDPPRAPTIAFEPALDDDPSTWQFLQEWPTQQHRLALAVRRTGRDLSVRMREVVP